MRIFLNVVDKFNNLSSLSINDNVINKKLDTNKSNDINIFDPNKDIDIVKSFVGTVKENYKNLFLEKISANLDSISMNYNIENVSLEDYTNSVEYKAIKELLLEDNLIYCTEFIRKLFNLLHI